MHFLLIDGLNLIRRIFGAQPGEEQAAAEATVVTANRSLRRCLRQTQATHALCVFDRGVPSWRQQQYADYKAQRKPMPEPLAQQLPEIGRLFAEAGVSSCWAPEPWEADDVLASIAYRIQQKASQAPLKVTILSTDAGFLQLLPYGIHVRDHFKEIDWDLASAEQKYGLPAEKLIDYWALVGNRGQGVPGVAGIGAKGAVALLQSLSSPLQLDQIETKQAVKISPHWESFELSRKLVTMRLDCQMGWSLKECRLPAH